MRKLFTLSRLAAFLLTAMLALPLQTFAEDIQLNLKKGEIYNGEWATHVFKVGSQNPGPMLTSGNVDFFPTELENDEHGNKQYKIGNIYCPMTEGTSTILVQPAIEYDEWGNSSNITYTITVNVSGTYVTAAAASDNVSASSYEPDPAVLHDLTLAPGASAYNWMKLAYVSSTGYTGYPAPAAPENFVREWMAVPGECVTITSSDPNIVEVSNGQFIARGTDGQSATITMSCAPSGEYLDVPTGSVSFTVNIDGSAAVEKEDIDMYFQDYDNSTYQNVRISEFEMIMDETGYYESHTIEFKWSLPGVPNVTFTSSDDQLLEVYADPDTDNDRYLVSFYPHSYGNFTITATFAGDAQYNQVTATLDVSVINSRYSFAKDLVFKEQSDPSSPYNQYDVIVDHLEMTEGETVKLPELCHRYERYPASHTLFPSQSAARGHFVAPWLNPSCHDVGCAVDVEHITAVAAGRDTLVVKYHFYSDEPLETVKLPIRILPLVQPVANNTETSFDFGSTTPGANSELIFQTTANDKVNDGKLEISTTLNPSQVETFIDRNAAGTQAWLDNLQGALTLNLPAGQGTLSIECYADPSVEFKLKIRGKAAVTIAQTSMGTAEVNFDLEEPTAVIIYLTGAGGYSPAPKRAPAAKAESAKGYIKSISIAPRADIAAKQDPDNAGVYYSTFFDSSRKFTLPAGTEAYVATISGGDMIMNKVVNGGEVLPANTPVILKSNVASLSLTPTDDAAVTISAENALHGVDEATAAPANCYVLSGHSTDNSVTGVGFYEFTGKIPAHKAYLTISDGAAYAPKKLRFVFNNEQQATGIDNAADGIMSEKRLENGQLVIIKNGVRYNAQGQVIQ